MYTYTHRYINSKNSIKRAIIIHSAIKKKIIITRTANVAFDPESNLHY